MVTNCWIHAYFLYRLWRTKGMELMWTNGTTSRGTATILVSLVSLTLTEPCSSFLFSSQKINAGRSASGTRFIANKLSLICSHNQEARNIFQMFQTRELLHRQAYMHKTARVVERMLADAFVSADQSGFIIPTGKVG